MATVLMSFAVFISVVFVTDFVKTILELRRDRIAMKKARRKSGGFHV